MAKRLRMRNQKNCKHFKNVNEKTYRKSGTRDQEPWGETLRWDPKVGPYSGTQGWDPSVRPNGGTLRRDLRVGPAFMVTQHSPYPFIFKLNFPNKMLHLTQ